MHFTASIAAALLSSAVASAVGGAPQPATAQLTFEIGFSTEGSVGRSMTQQYRIGETDDPERSKSAKIFSWGARKPKTFSIAAGRLVFVFAQLSQLHGAPGISASGKNWCVDAISFIPQAGGRYRIKQTGAPGGPCSLAIEEQSRGGRV